MHKKPVSSFQFPVLSSLSCGRRFCRPYKKIASPWFGNWQFKRTALRTNSTLRFWPSVLIPRRLMRSLVLLLRCAILRRRGLLALLLPVAELVLIVPGLGRVSFLHRRRRLGLRMRPALRRGCCRSDLPRLAADAEPSALQDAPARPPAGPQSAAADGHRAAAFVGGRAFSGGLTGCCGRASGRSVLGLRNTGVPVAVAAHSAARCVY